MLHQAGKHLAKVI